MTSAMISVGENDSAGMHAGTIHSAGPAQVTRRIRARSRARPTQNHEAIRSSTPVSRRAHREPIPHPGG
jgi:hypothetical protein